MKFSRLLFVVAYLASILVYLASALYDDPSYLYHQCSGDTYTSNSIYQNNLNTLLSSLSSKSNNDIDYGFYNFSEGQGIDRVKAIALCRGDISRTACSRCVNISTTDLPQRCPNQKEAIVWYDKCMLRYYSNKSIFGNWEGPAFFIRDVKNVSDANQFLLALGGLLSILREQAASGGSRVKFAIGNTKGVYFPWIYGLVQCIPSLTEHQCSYCLYSSFRNITDAVRKEGGIVMGPSCNVRYDIYQFYEIPSPPSLPASPPPGIAPPTPTATEIVP